MNRKRFLAVTFFAMVSLTLAVVPLSNQQSGGGYDPWMDLNEDGKVDVNELHAVGQAYGASGDPTKNVTIVKHATKVIRVARSVSIPATSSWYSDPINIDGYSKVTVLIYLDSSSNAYFLRASDPDSFYWLADQVNNFGGDFVKTYDVMSGEIYLEVYNGGASTASLDANVYLVA